MLTGGFSPCLPRWPIYKIKLQGKYQGYEIDDMIVFANRLGSDQHAKMLAQIKHTVSITKGNKVFGEVILAAWKDFNNAQLFSESHDAISLITGPLSSIDTDATRALLEQARHSESPEDFLERVNRGKFTSDEQRDKLEAFKTQLSAANNGNEVTDDQLWRFLKCFHLLIYDLDIKGVTLSLLHTLINQHSSDDPEGLWARILDRVAWESENAGFVTVEALPDDISSLFKRKVAESIPGALVRRSQEVAIEDWNRHPNAPELTIACMVGSWNEKSDSDKDIITNLSQMEFGIWLTGLREVLQIPGCPLILKNGIWSIKDRTKLWEALSNRIFDDNLDRLQQACISVLSERDPKFEIDKEDRFAAAIHGKVLKHSQVLRNGLAESLALLAIKPDLFSKCTIGKPEAVVNIAVRNILHTADWVLWAGLGDLLPLLAEAAAEEFLSAVESALQQSPSPFDSIFAQEGSGVTGWNYITGLLWAIETLAWEEQYLVRAIAILGDLARHDPGGSWANRPFNSMTTILLPWMPQTIASFEKRKVAVQTLLKELPDVGWNLLIALLPNQHQMSMGSHKPKWRNSIPAGWEEKVTNKDYWMQVFFYADLAVETAKSDIGKLNRIISNLDNLPKESFEKLLAHLASEPVLATPEPIRLRLWSGLIDFVLKHRRHANADWALPPEVVTKVEETANVLHPQNPMSLHARLFSGRDFDLFEGDGDWDTQRQQLEHRREDAIKEILTFGGIDAVLEFITNIESPMQVGHSLAAVGNESIDSTILPSKLDIDNTKMIEFIGSYVRKRYLDRHWEWVDAIDMSKWSTIQTNRFLMSLPFSSETWQRVEQLLAQSVEIYWKNVSVNPYQSTDVDSYAIDKLIEHGRPHAAITYLHTAIIFKKKVDIKRIVKALIAGLSSDEPTYTMNSHNIAELIKVLQDSTETNPNELFQIEWAYLPLLDGYRGTLPKYLAGRLASDSAFFCEVIQKVYKPKDAPKNEITLSEQELSIAQNAWRLLHEWRTPPGLKEDGSFSADALKKWLAETKAACSQSGHTEVALRHIGNVLFHSPADPSGLWLHNAAAEVLNEKEAERMRNGFCSAAFGSRGVHWIDPTGKPELEIAAKYREKSVQIEDAGYQRLAAAIRGLADSYEHEARRIIDEHETDERV